MEITFLFLEFFFDSLSDSQFSIDSQEPRRSTRSLTVSDFKDDLKSVTTNPALEKTLSEAVEVAGVISQRNSNSEIVVFEYATNSMNPQGLLLYVEGEASFYTISILLKLSVRDKTNIPLQDQRLEVDWQDF
jgi:hypothetical protein